MKEYKSLEELKQMHAQMVANREERWRNGIPRATAKCMKTLEKEHPCDLYNLHFDRVDAKGYWFEYQLLSDPETKRTLCIGHYDIYKEG